MATLLWLEPLSSDEGQALLIAALDHCILDGADVERMRLSVATSAGARLEQVLLTLSHTHAAGLMSRSRASLPGGELVGPYLDGLASKLGALAAETRAGRQPATILYGRGRCSLAANRDYFDADAQRYVCGLNPDGMADDTVLVAQIHTDHGKLLASVVNYACHPTTLAWQNALISPDYVGSLRETVEQQTDVPCLFLQGASGDLGPREGFVGETSVADRNGRCLGFAALAALASLPQPRTRFRYQGPVVSGAIVGTWAHEPLDQASLRQISAWRVTEREIPLAYRPDLPTVEQTQADLLHWQEKAKRAAAGGHEALHRECHARIEQMTRQLWRLKAVAGRDNFPFKATVARLGDAVWVFVPGEHYQLLQTTLRQRFPRHPIIVVTLTNGWQPGYIPPAEMYERGIYQEEIAVVAAGSAEAVIEAIALRIEDHLLNRA